MLGTRMWKIIGDIWARKTRTLLAATSVFIGVFGVVALSSAGEILVTQLEKDLQADRLAMMRSQVVLKQGVDIDNQAALEQLREADGVITVEGRAVYPVFWHLEGEDDFNEGVVAAHSEAFDDSELEPTRLIEGAYPIATDDPDRVQIAIERRMADSKGLVIGDTLELRALGASEGAMQTVTAEIVGIAFQAYGYQILGGINSPSEMIFADLSDMPTIAGTRGFSIIYSRFTDFETAEAQETAFTSAVARADYIPAFTVLEDPAANSQIESTRSTNNLLVVLAVVALIVSGFLVFNVVNAIVTEQKRQIGLLKALGATRSDNFFIYGGIAFAYGLLGVIPGVALGIPAGYFFAQGLAITSETIIETFTVSSTGLILGVVLGLGIPVLGALLPVLNGTRVRILDAMTDLGIDASFGKSRFDRLVSQIKLPMSLRQAVRNAYQKRFRLILTGLTLTLASAAFMGVFAVFSSLASLVDTAFDTFGYEISITPNEAQDFDTIESLLQSNVDGIAKINPSTSLSVDVEGFDPPPVQAGPPGLFAQGFNTADAELLNLDYLEGEGWQNDPDRAGVVLSISIANATGYEVGDQVNLTVGGNTQSYEIIGVAQSVTDIVWMNWEDLSELGGLVNASGAAYPNAVDVTLEGEDLSADEVSDTIDAINETLLANGVSASYTNQVELANLITTIVTAFGAILSMAALLIALVGAVGLLTTLSMSVFERQKEIGVMRSVGAGSGVILTQFLFEGLIIGLIAWIVAAPLSVLVSQGLIEVLPFGGTFEIGYPPIALLAGFIGMVVLVAAASLLPSLAAARKTVSDILRYQ